MGHMTHFLGGVSTDVGVRQWLLFLHFLCLACGWFSPQRALGVEVLSKSKIEKCEKSSGSNALNCTSKIVVNLAVPSEFNGGEASIVAELVEAEEDSSRTMQTIRKPPIITVNKSAVYALYQLSYLRDVPYKPEEYYVKTRKCEPDAGADVVKICERLRDEQGNFIDVTKPICCPCGPWRRAPSSCGSKIAKMFRGKRNTAHCLRFPGEWQQLINLFTHEMDVSIRNENPNVHLMVELRYHVFRIERRSIGFSIRIEVKEGIRTSEVIVGPEKRTALSSNSFLRVNLIGDFVGYTSIPILEGSYLAIPRQGPAGQPQTLGGNFSRWMVLDSVRFSVGGIECDKIGVSYEAFNAQPNFCSSPLRSCLHNQLSDFWESDQNRIGRNQTPEYAVQARFGRINQHPIAGTHSFSIGINETWNSNLLIELNADDIEYVYQRSPGKILSVTIPTFEALTQFGTAAITTKNIGKLEASYSLMFDCSEGVSKMEEQFFIMKSEATATRVFKVYPTTDQAAKYECKAILKDSAFNEIDQAVCQFTTTATILNNGSIILPDFGPKKDGVNGIFASVEETWKSVWGSFIDFVTGKSCRSKCSSFFDFGCHIQYICLSWIAMSFLLLLIFPTVIVLLWLLHQKGFFDPLYDWWEDHFSPSIINENAIKHRKHFDSFEYDDHCEERRNFREAPNKDRHHVMHDHHHHHHRHHLRHKHKPSLDYVGHARTLKSRKKHNRMGRNGFDDKRSYHKTHEDLLGKKGMIKNPRTYEALKDQLRRQKRGKK